MEDVYLYRAAVFGGVFFIVHLIFEIFSARQAPFKRLTDQQMLPPMGKRPAVRRSQPPTVAVTGGVGFLGSAIVSALVQSHFRVVVLDRALPSPERRVAGAEYHVVDVVSDDYGIVFNAHVIATQRIIRAARLAGVQCIVGTSSSGAVTSPYIPEASQQNIRSDFRLSDDWYFFSHYSKTKYEAESLLLKSNDPENNFYTAALRMPGIYGVGDTMMVDAISSGLMTFVPGGGPVRKIPTDFCFVHNAADAHVLALKALLRRKPGVAGQTFNVTNGDPQDTLEMWNNFISLLSKARARSKAMARSRSAGSAAGSSDATTTTTATTPPPKYLFRMPYIVCLVLACTSEFLFWFLAGRVPFRRNAFWNFTRSSLDLVQVSITLDITQTRKVLGYSPRFDNLASFRHIVREMTTTSVDDDVLALDASATRSPPVDSPLPTSSQVAKKRVEGWGSSRVKVIVQQAKVDWTQRPLSTYPVVVRAFEKLSGPGSSASEVTVVFFATTLSLCVAHALADPAWTTVQYATAMGFAFINGSAAVQCMTPTSKRWYHAGGQLSVQLFLLMVAEAAFQVFVLEQMFFSAGGAGAADDGRFTVQVAGPLVVSMALVYMTELPVQRAMGVLLFMGLAAYLTLFRRGSGVDAGVQWVAPLLCLKYLVSHIPRYEPYD